MKLAYLPLYPTLSATTFVDCAMARISEVDGGKRSVKRSCTVAVLLRHFCLSGGKKGHRQWRLPLVST